MQKIKRYIHALQSGTKCNLRCSYCYVPTLEDENRAEPTKFNYPLEQIAKAISKERLGGIALITYVGGGETFLTDESVQLVKLFLEEGHIVNAVSNMTYTPAIEKFCSFPPELRARLQFSGSFHYKELIKRNLIDTYFDNCKKFDEAGIVYYVNLTLGPDCLDSIDDIKKLVNDRTGRNPFILYCLDPKNNWERCSFYTKEFINDIANKFDCPHLILEDKESYGKYRTEFCYMGDWGFVFNLETGYISGCFDSPAVQNIVEDITKPIKFEAVGKCCSHYCSMGARFLGLGVIPEIKEFSNYNELYSRYKNNPKDSVVAETTNNYLWETNNQYSNFRKKIIKLKRKLNRNYRIGTWMEKIKK